LILFFLPSISSVFRIKKVHELANHKRKLVLEQIVTTIAAVADTCEDKFEPFYEKFMPTLKFLFVNATTSELRLLRGKTIECISMIGLAVGKDKVSAFFFVFNRRRSIFNI
jgi:hypothetical protein